MTDESDWKNGEPRALVWANEPGSSPVLYVCRCGQVYSPNIYACGIEEGREHARRAAADCVSCREVTVEQSTAQERDRLAARIAKANVVSNLQHCFGDSSGTFFSDPSDAADAGETGVFGATFVPFSLDLGSAIESMLEHHHDDAAETDLEGIQALYDAVDQFNSKQTGGSYEMDEREWQKLPQTRTFAMIKPDATERGIENEMLKTIADAGFTVIEQRRVTLERTQAEWLYREHKERAHFNDLVDYTISGEVLLLCLEGTDDNVPAAFRMLMGPTDRTKAGPETLRGLYAIGLRENSIHGSDSPSAAVDELLYFMG